MEPALLGVMDGQVVPHCFTHLDTQLNRIIKTLLLSWKDIIIIIIGKDKELALIWIIVFIFLSKKDCMIFCAREARDCNGCAINWHAVLFL